MPKADNDEVTVLKEKVRQLEWIVGAIVLFLVAWFFGWIPVGVSQVERELKEVKKTVESDLVTWEGLEKIVGRLLEANSEILIKTQTKVLKTLDSRIDGLESKTDRLDSQTIKKTSFPPECEYSSLSDSFKCGY